MNLKQEYMSTHHGAMFATWPGGALGRGSNRLVIDDPHPPGDAWSEAGRESTLKFYRGSLFSRLDHPATDSILVCHSRLHEDDLIGVLHDPDGDRGDRNDRNDPLEVGVGSVLSPDPSVRDRDGCGCRSSYPAHCVIAFIVTIPAAATVEPMGVVTRDKRVAAHPLIHGGLCVDVGSLRAVQFGGDRFLRMLTAAAHRPSAGDRVV
jgi:hypothetical protein